MKLKNASADFILHCKFEKNLMPKTIKAYETDLCQFVVFLNGIDSITEISKHEIRNYLTHISLLKPKSIKRKIATLKALFNYLEFEDKIPSNPFRKMRIKIREPQLLRSVMDIREIVKVFKNIYKEKHKTKIRDRYSYFVCVRNIVLVELLFTSGARVSEIANLTAECINLRSGAIIIKGKGNKERIIQICNKETLDILNEYMTLYKIEIIKSGGNFLLNRSFKKISEQSIRNIVSKLCKNAGIAKHITPHVFRHTFATLLLEKDVDIKYIQHLLGHSSIMTTQIYTHVNRKRQRHILTTKHPRKDFSMLLS